MTDRGDAEGEREKETNGAWQEKAENCDEQEVEETAVDDQDEVMEKEEAQFGTGFEP